MLVASTIKIFKYYYVAPFNVKNMVISMMLSSNIRGNL